ncbi:MAG: hypothetical protein U0Y82_00525 [Thermoleophilia bacterium]
MAVPSVLLLDAEQQRTHMRLRRVLGEEQAAFFLDACLLMETEHGFTSTSHLVGHLLREIDGGLLEVVRSLAPGRDWPKKGSKGSHRATIVCACVALGLGSDVPDRWSLVVAGQQKVAHRHSRGGPRPVDEALRERWREAQLLFAQVTDRLEARIGLSLAAAERIASGAPDMTVFHRDLPHSQVALDRFFEFAGPEWLDPLLAGGAFRSPPPLVVSSDGAVRFVRWPPGAYLIRMAGARPAAILDVAVGLETDNPEAHESIVDAAMAMDAELAAKLVPRVRHWLQSPVQWALPWKAASMAEYLVANEQIEAGLVLAGSVVEALGLHRGSQLAPEMVRRFTVELFPAAGVAGVAMLGRLLAQGLESEGRGSEDFSYIWRPQLGVEQRQDVVGSLVTAVRTAARTVVDHAPVCLDEMLEVLDNHELAVFRRFGIDLLVSQPFGKRTQQRLLSYGLMASPDTQAEYAELLRAHSAALSEADRRAIERFIESGPDQDGGTDDVDERWRLSWLAVVPWPLSEVMQQRFEALRERFGDPGPLRKTVVVSGAGWPEGAHSGAEDLAALSPEEVVDWLASHQVEGGPEGLSHESLVREVVAARALEFSLVAQAFVNLHPAHARALACGLQQALRNGDPIEWAPVVEFVLAVLQQPRGHADPWVGPIPEHGAWLAVWMTILNLLIDALGAENPIPQEERDRVWAAIERLAQDENPTPADERAVLDAARDPLTLAMNTVRGKAIQATMGYIRRFGPEDGGIPAEAAALLERHLDLDNDQSVAVRSIYGWHLPLLAHQDREWVSTNLSRILPSDDELRWRAAWAAYVTYHPPYSWCFSLLERHYAHAIEHLSDDPDLEDPDGPGTGLLRHLAAAARAGLVHLEDPEGLLALLYARASLTQRALLIRAIGHGLGAQPPPAEEECARAMAIFDARLAVVEASAQLDDRAELAGFAVWFACGALGRDWALARLLDVLRLDVKVDQDRGVASQLAEDCSSRPVECLDALELLIDRGSDEWFVPGASDLIPAILTKTLPNPACAARVREIASRLVARGHAADYKRFLA